MSTFLNALAVDAVNIFLSDLGEPIIYTPYQTAPETINAVIFRKPQSGQNGFDGMSIYKHEIQIANDPNFGRIIINVGKDTVQFASVVGGPVETFTVVVVTQNDQGMWTLGVG
jgi:hypothetical protein